MATLEADVTGGQQPEAKRKRMTVFRAADGVELDHEQMPFEGVDASVMAGFGKLMAAGAAETRGEKTRMLFREPGEKGLSLAYAWFKSGYVLPKHSHNADCVYYLISGELRMGTQVLRKGDGVFIPADQGYTFDVGPEGVEVLEFRNATQFNIFFKDNEEAHWDKMAESTRSNVAKWAEETVPPSER